MDLHPWHQGRQQFLEDSAMAKWYDCLMRLTNLQSSVIEYILSLPDGGGGDPTRVINLLIGPV